MRPPSHRGQLIASLGIAALIILLTVVVVTVRLGSTSQAELDLREEIAEERAEAAEERAERVEDLRERD